MTAAIATVLLLATLAQLGALIALHVLPTGLSPVRDPVSQYALTRFRAGYTISALSAAVAGAATALLLGSLPGGGIAAGLLWLFAAARAAIPAIPMDVPGTPPTRRGRWHSLLATLAFAGVTAASFFAAGPAAQAGGRALATFTLVAGAIMALGSAGVVLSRFVQQLRTVFGAAERLIYLGSIVWFAASAIATLAS